MWNIEGNKIGPLILGMTTTQAIAILGDKYHTFKRVPQSMDTIYAYDDEGLHLTCLEGVVNVISVFRPRELFYKSVQLLGRPLKQVADELTTIGIVGANADAGYWVGQAGVLLVEVNGVIDGVELYPIGPTS